MKITQTEMISRIRKSCGKIMTVKFIKRTDGKVRVMNCRTEVKKRLRGGDSKIRPCHRLIAVYDLKSKGYRSIPEEGVFEVRIGGQILSLVPKTEEVIQTAVFGG